MPVVYQKIETADEVAEYDDGDEDGQGGPAWKVAHLIWSASKAVWSRVPGGKADTRVSQKEVTSWLVERTKFIPLRLSISERSLLRLLEAALVCTDYTSNVDHTNFKNPARRIQRQMQDICAMLSGLVLASDYEAGSETLKEHNFKDYSDFFRCIFEIARRYKIMNPGTECLAAIF